jgi:hypothetical protein
MYSGQDGDLYLPSISSPDYNTEKTLQDCERFADN